MKSPNSILCVVITSLALSVAGCGPSKDELAARENARIEQEKQAARDAEKANKAITENNKKMFGRMNSSSPGASTPEPTPNPSSDAKKP